MRTKRIDESDVHIDESEREWWNMNAPTVEKIWAQNIDFQKSIRLPYLSRMRGFFLKGAKNLPIRILEIGCGTGWVCRLIAGKDIHIIGTDFSEGQLAIARSMAQKLNKAEFCTYELADASTFQKEVDGVVIHALLHHLSSEELNKFFDEFSQLPKGTRVFLYEPVFFQKQSGKPSFRDKVINKLIYKLKNYALNKAKQVGSEDVELSSAMNKITLDAEKNGWYISPKEVPFAEGELESYLGPHFQILDKYIVNKTELDIAQALTMNAIERPGFLFSKILIPLSRSLDKLSFSGKFTHYLHPYQHLFVCFEAIKK